MIKPEAPIAAPHPHLRALDFCPQCFADKRPGLVMCWPCWHAHNEDADLLESIACKIEEAMQ